MSTANAAYMLQVEASRRAASTAAGSSDSENEHSGDEDETGDGVGLPSRFSSLHSATTGAKNMPAAGAGGASKDTGAIESAAAARRRSLASQLAR